MERSGRVWGRFNVHIEGRHPLLRVVSSMMNWRSCVTGIPTGDQAIFVDCTAFQEMGGFPLQPLMEDIALSRALRRNSRPLCLAEIVTTSGRRWEKHGLARTVFLMWWLRFRYWLGTSPALLAKTYYSDHD